MKSNNEGERERAILQGEGRVITTKKKWKKNYHTISKQMEMENVTVQMISELDLER